MKGKFPQPFPDTFQLIIPLVLSTHVVLETESIRLVSIWIHFLIISVNVSALHRYSYLGKWDENQGNADRPQTLHVPFG